MSLPQALMFWVVDNFLMRKGKTKAKLEERGSSQDSRNGSKVRYRRAASHEEPEAEVGLPVWALLGCWGLSPSQGRQRQQGLNMAGLPHPHCG